MGSYELICPGCGRVVEDSYTNLCPNCGSGSPLLRTKYEDARLLPLNVEGFWKFLPWLPCGISGPKFNGMTVVYESEHLAAELGLKNLHIAFNGYWPERNANLITCTFKELEAPPTLQRAQEKGVLNMVLPSAGNTARAFINGVRTYDIKLYVVIPYNYKHKLVLPFEVTKNVKVIAVNNGADYSDSIAFATRMTKELGWVNEGGARNVARRDGLGTVLLEAVLHTKKIPKHYFQAVGSGTGGIAAWEASKRLLADGRFGEQPMKLHLSQNHPFTPMVDAWNKNLKELPKETEAQQKEAIVAVYAQVLTNRNPPYSIGGGMYDALTASNGVMYSISNDEALSAGKLFEKTEGIDIVPASCVAVASLKKATEEGGVATDDLILLNITGGGGERLEEDYDMHRAHPDLVCDRDTDMQDLKNALEDHP